MTLSMNSQSQTTIIRKANWLVGWDESNKRHVYLRDADLVFADREIVHVGKTWEGDCDHEIDGRGSLVMPGLINIHTHLGSEPVLKGVTDEVRSPGFWHSSLYEFLSIFDVSPETSRLAMQVALSELLMSGVTTVADLSTPYDGWLDVLAISGIRAYAAPGFKDARWRTENGYKVSYDWDVDAGRAAFETAISVVEEARKHPSGRLDGMMVPAQIDTCTAELFRDAWDFAKRHGYPIQTHASQSLVEFYEMTSRNGKTPIQWLDEIGVLEDMIVGHAIFLDHHPYLNWTTRTDLGLLAERNATVAHCPTQFSRRGFPLRTFGEYVRKGINLGLGTDTYPHNIIEEMRSALMSARMTAGSVDDLKTVDVFNAATIGGAKALNRADIGKLTPGAKADIVLVDLRNPSMLPLREPLRSLIYAAGERPIRDVFVDGVNVVRDHKVRTIDYQAVAEALDDAQKEVIAKVSEADWRGRNIDEMSPMVLQIVDGA